MRLSMISSKFQPSKLIYSLKKAPQTRRSPLRQLWESWLQELKQSSQVQVWQTSDRHGNISWSGRDPINERAISQVSEDCIRVWLEQRDRLVREKGR
jgi:hypothetical protein